jgi:DNA polymerase III epsilon subunit-like protein
MNLLSIDIELNQLLTPKVIEIGAVAFKSHTGEILGTFHTYVDPKEPITEFIIGLTGITDEKVKGAPSITEAYFLLKAFHKKHRCPRNPVLWGSGVRNDSHTIWEEAKPLEENFMGFRVIDAKTLYQSLQMYSNGAIKAGLRAACDNLGIGWDSTHGPEHRAVPDAFNTARIWHHLMHKMSVGVKMCTVKHPTPEEKANMALKEIEKTQKFNEELRKLGIGAIRKIKE